MKRRGKWVAAVAVVVALSGAALGAWYAVSSAEDEERGRIEAKAGTRAVVQAVRLAVNQASAVASAGDAARDEGGDGRRRVPIPAVDTRAPAWLSMSQARENGDERAPPVERNAPATHPDASVLADPQAYTSYQLAQKQRLAAAYSQAAVTEVGRLQADLEKGREAGIPPEELAKVAEKIRRIEQQRQSADALLSNGKGQ